MSEVIGLMKERGRVIETLGNVAKVEIFRRDECSRCKVCGFGSRDKIVAHATNTVGAKARDEVELELEGSQVVRAAAIMYLVPLAFFLVGLYLGNLYASYIHRQDIAAVASAVLGFALLGLSYVLISQYSRGPAISQYRAKIIRIVSRDQD
ncbi:MAG: SoxR reducing system RseC family protein [Bacillota bacterium]|jgi:sigma-E factor negative regulatory protein RseC